VARVLVVEDEDSFSDALSYMLRKEGFEVSVAATGTSALTEFDRTGADIVLLDLMLPEMSGTEVCRQLRSRSHVPIIMVTARDSEIDKVVGLEIGADDYVTKPFSLRELSARVRALLRRSTAREDRPLGAYRGDRLTADLKAVSVAERARSTCTSAGYAASSAKRRGRSKPSSASVTGSSIEASA